MGLEMILARQWVFGVLSLTVLIALVVTYLPGGGGFASNPGRLTGLLSPAPGLFGLARDTGAAMSLLLGLLIGLKMTLGHAGDRRSGAGSQG